LSAPRAPDGPRPLTLRASECLDDEALLAISERALDPLEQEAVSAHLDRCPRCLRLVADVMRSLEAPVAAAEDRAAGEIVPGERVGRYRVIEHVGQGAMGEVFAAEDTWLKRKVALKVLRASRAPGATEVDPRARLWREAQALAQLSHSNLIAVFDVLSHCGRIVIAMEYVPGGTLRRWMVERRRGWREVVAVFLQAGRGLAATHAAGLVHRDFKPDNVLIGADGLARVSDFGLAALLSEGAVPPAAAGLCAFAAELTATGHVLGTPAYMAPDQLEGMPATPSSDQFSFAVSLWEMLYGSRPFSGADFKGLAEAIRARRISSSVARGAPPASVRRVLLRALAAEPEGRYPSMQALLAALERASRWTGKRVLAHAASALVALGAAATLARGPPLSRCPPPERLLEGVWDAPAQTVLRSALGAPAAARIDRAIAEYLGRWSEAYRDSCEATWRRREQSERVFFSRMACFQGLLEDVRAEVRAIESSVDGAALRAEHIDRALRPLDSCAAPPR
jgi:tRNA A-37 threonylcarbamoyl transferase component Bud32